eukprot:1631449-Alexandrium_andersonii.AAC.1
MGMMLLSPAPRRLARRDARARKMPSQRLTVHPCSTCLAASELPTTLIQATLISSSRTTYLT